MVAKCYTAAETARAAGVTYRMLDYWVRFGVLRPVVPAAGSGSLRLFDERQVAVLRAVAVLAGLGARVPVLRRVAGYLDRLPGEHWAGLLFVAEDGTVVPGPAGGCRVVDLGECAAGLGDLAGPHLARLAAV